jgi:hypothetical protein
MFMCVGPNAHKHANICVRWTQRTQMFPCLCVLDPTHTNVSMFMCVGPNAHKCLWFSRKHGSEWKRSVIHVYGQKNDFRVVGGH